MSLDREPDLEALVDDANDDDKEIKEKPVDPSRDMMRDGFLGTAGADAGNKEADEAKANKDAEERRIAEAKAKTEEEVRLATLGQKLDGTYDSKGEYPKAAPEEHKPVETAEVAQNEIADRQREVAESSGALIQEKGPDKIET